jgi:cellulose synthase/poly-beta-1,6-N-acetylglucosamine synthase-like glycosyltransferase
LVNRQTSQSPSSKHSIAAAASNTARSDTLAPPEPQRKSLRCVNQAGSVAYQGRKVSERSGVKSGAEKERSWPRRSTWALIAIASVAPIVYPLWVALRSHRRPDRTPPEPVESPGLSVVVPAYKEREVIAAKVEDLRRNGYRGELEVLVVTEDLPTAEAARATDARVLNAGERLGKAEAVNRGVAAARQPIVVLTDADTRLEPGSLAAMARWFVDPDVGAVAGEKRVEGATEEFYWAFESWLKRKEALGRTTIGIVGELAAVRRSAYRQLPQDVSVDDLWMGLDVIEQGRAIRYEPEAIAVERQGSGLWAGWERRTRTIAGLLDLLWRRRRLLVPHSSPVSVELWGHKLIRAAFGPLAHAALIVQALASLPRSRLAAGFLVGHLVALLASAREAPTLPERLAARVLFLQAAGVGGTIRYLRGDRPAAWPKRERPAESSLAFRHHPSRASRRSLNRAV